MGHVSLILRGRSSWESEMCFLLFQKTFIILKNIPIKSMLNNHGLPQKGTATIHHETDETTDHDSKLFNSRDISLIHYTIISPLVIFKSTLTSSRFHPSQVTSTKGSTCLTLPLPLPSHRRKEGRQRHSEVK